MTKHLPGDERPDADASDAAPGGAAQVPAPRESARWIRPTALVLFALTLPFTWKETTPHGCDGHPLGPGVTETGVQLFTREVEASLVMLLLVAAVLTLGWIADHVGPLGRLAAHLVAAVASTMLSLLALFAATFSLFSPVRLRFAAYVGITALALSAIEALVRAGVAFARWLPTRLTGD